MHGMKWRGVGVVAGLLAVVLTGCGITGGGTTVTKTPDPKIVQQEKDQREKLKLDAYVADIEANTARDAAAIRCRPLTTYKDLTSLRCKAEAQRQELFNKSQNCLKAVDAYNKRRGPDGEILRFKSSNPDRGEGLVITCGFDQN